jgi:DNA polymerase-3 subunit epsilon/exodeoxyribonuclease X
MRSWRDEPVVVFDLEGSGAQDREAEAILEIAVVPLTAGLPLIPAVWTTLINPGRPIPRRPWISPGLTAQALATAPALTDITAELTERLDGKVIAGHNIGVDWRLLSRHCPAISPAALVDTLRLARHLRPAAGGNSLTSLLEHYELTEAVTALAPGSRPHRAAWDAIGAALLLARLAADLPGGNQASLADLRQVAGYPVMGNHAPAEPGQPALPGL